MTAWFVWHGNPMNAIGDNAYHRSWQKSGGMLSCAPFFSMS